ncbi:phytoene desaturase family protein [Paenibacillus beijingensis]|uniref:Capsular biosynthesis protein CpsH n=1 Tax=Paenibacillus beijingensis TaxID=1126833 RepID=A0A0D5NHC4_9BACL|nr:phytoene desaturase family protein [Paenibacillus beijingensis]AJY74656.1 capsular biosynthesis protein CpsH [Paenibacillus beijingensis]
MKITIVGAGVGGLVTALLLRRQGHEVTLYEKESQVGGCIARESNGEFSIDQGPTIVLLPHLLREILRQAGIPDEAVELLPCDPLYDIYESDGTKWTKWRDPDKQATEIERCYRGGGSDFRRYMADMERIFDYGYEAFLSRTFVKKRAFLTLRNLAFLARSRAYRALKPFTASYFRDPRLQDAYSLQSLYIGGAPRKAPALYGLIPYSEHRHGIWYIKGGFRHLADVLEQACRDSGVTIRCSAPVTAIHVEKGVCKGVTVAGEAALCDAVVFNGDYPMLDGILQGWRGRKKKKFRPSSGTLLIYLGVDKRWEGVGAHQFFFPESMDYHMADLFQMGRLSVDPTFYVFNPAAIDSAAAPEGKSVLYVRVPVPASEEIDWDMAGEAVVSRVLDKAERILFPGLKQAIRWQKVRTPRDAARQGQYLGGSFGIAPILTQIGAFRPQVKPLGVERLYAVGASVHPGGGVPIVMQGARLLSETICKELGS